MHPQELEIAAYTYPLPDERIAKHPLPERDGSKLLVYRNGNIEDAIYKNLTDHLPSGAQLVFNNTRVVQARLEFQRPSGARIEVFCLEPAKLDIQQAMTTKEEVSYIALVGNAKKWKEESLELPFSFNGRTETLRVEKTGRDEQVFELHFRWTGLATWAEVLEVVGSVPLPPYLRRTAEEADKQRYQTVYARHEGSVAAPTAGLHFTPRLLQELRSQGFGEWSVTLHVGAGTFKPVDSNTLAGHTMHHEPFRVSRAFLQYVAMHPDTPFIPVGTTSMRTLESLYWMGVRALQGLPWQEVMQWDPYQLPSHFDNRTVLLALLANLEGDELWGMTQLMIAPGYHFRFCKGLLTNFHQPKSTLMLLVAALVGDDWKKIYQHALDNDYRFLSYGDGSLLLPRP